MNKNVVHTIVVFKLILIVSCVQAQTSVDELKYESSTVVRNFNNLTRIEEILELFSVDVIGSQWKLIHGKIQNELCAKNMIEYLEGLQNKKVWAIKSKLLKWSAVAKRLLKRASRQTFHLILRRKFHFYFESEKEENDEKIIYQSVCIDNVNLTVNNQRGSCEISYEFWFKDNVT